MRFFNARIYFWSFLAFSSESIIIALIIAKGFLRKISSTHFFSSINQVQDFFWNHQRLELIDIPPFQKSQQLRFRPEWPFSNLRRILLMQIYGPSWTPSVGRSIPGGSSGHNWSSGLLIGSAKNGSATWSIYRLSTSQLPFVFNFQKISIWSSDSADSSS